jgi:hypothetical protein
VGISFSGVGNHFPGVGISFPGVGNHFPGVEISFSGVGNSFSGVGNSFPHVCEDFFVRFKSLFFQKSFFPAEKTCSLVKENSFPKQINDLLLKKKSKYQSGTISTNSPISQKIIF